MHNFTDWAHLLERAVRVTTRSRNEAVLNNLFLDWLPLKLDDEFFIDSQEEHKWQAKMVTKWDGKESIHKLANCVSNARIRTRDCLMTSRKRSITNTSTQHSKTGYTT